MNVSLPKITIPDLTPKEKQGLQDYWSVYEIHREEINAQLAEMAIHHPEFKIILQDTAAQLTAEEQVRNREIQKNAIYQDDWEPYLKNLQRQGMGYAQAGLSFHAWFEIVDAFRKYMTPYLLHAFGEEPERLLSTINGMDNLLDTTMSVIGEAYLEMKQQLIRQQEETVRDAERQKQSEKRFRGLLCWANTSNNWYPCAFGMFIPSTGINMERIHACDRWALTSNFMRSARMELSFRWRSV